MAQVTISSTPSPARVRVGGRLTLSASLSGTQTGAASGRAARWRWERASSDTPGDWQPVSEETPIIEVDASRPGVWIYRATLVSVDGKPASSPPPQPAIMTVDITSAAGWKLDTPPPTTPLRFQPVFAGIAAGVLILLLAWFVAASGVLSLVVDLAGDAAAADARAAIAAKVIGPVLAIGVGLLAIGTWMVLVEWYGAFVAPKETDGVSNKGGPVVEAIAALKDLKGSSLIVIGGIVVILSVSWMVSATAAGGSETPAADPSSPASVSPSPSSTE